MPAPVNRSNLYYLFHANSKDLTPKKQKKFRNINIILGCTTLGIGHAICGIAYLIQKSSAKASKTNKVAQDKLNPSSSEPVNQLTDPNLIALKNQIGKCVATFVMRTSSIANLEKIGIKKGMGFYRSYPVQENLNKEALDKLILEILDDSQTLSLEHFSGTLTISLYGNSQEAKMTVSANLSFINGKLTVESGPWEATLPPL